MNRSSLLMSVYDIKSDDDDARSGHGETKGDDDESKGLIGEVAIPLKICAAGESMTDTFNIKNVDNET